MFLALLASIVLGGVTVQVTNSTPDRQIVYTECNGAVSRFGEIEATNTLVRSIQCDGELRVFTKTQNGPTYQYQSERVPVQGGDRLEVRIDRTWLNVIKR